jgi:uncharacterized membrane protein YeaQ/YmgE (transglycosylase-associated protein family)
VISYLIVVAFSGLIIGALGRLAIPGRNPMGIGMTMLCGIGGSLLGGLIGRALGLRSFGFMLAVLCAAGIVYLVSGRANRRRGIFDQGGVMSGRRRGFF